MPIATPEVYADMIRRAKEGGFAYPAINCTSSETVNAALRGFADAGSDGIIQFSTGGAEFAAGTKVKDMVTGAVALAEFAHVVAEKYPVQVALHTDHCPKDKLDSYVRPLVTLSQDRVAAGQEPLFQSHMWDGSAIDLEENLQIAQQLLEECAKAKIVLEVEIGVVGGEEDGVSHDINDKLYTAPGDFIRTAEQLGLGEKGVYLLAATFGNVHGVYKPGNVKLRPEILKEGQDVVAQKFGLPDGSKPFNLVFHGGSGSAQEEIREALSYGVVKMNVDTDTQYAFTRPIVDHMFKSYDGVLKVDGEVGNKKAYDPRSYNKLAETGMAARIVEACEDLLGEPPATLLPPNPEADAELAAGTPPAEVAAHHPTVSAVWAALAEEALSRPERVLSDTVEGYAYARTGYHRGLDALRRNGWKGFGPVPWSHEPNRGFLRSVTQLAKAAEAIGETDEQERCTQLLRDCDPTLAP
jgi:fructose-bisphosphate aldolase class II